MLFRNPVLEAICEGHVDLAFRRWTRARVLPGSRLRTRVGVLAVESVEVVAPADIGEDDARRAGFGSAGELLASLEPGREGDIHKVVLRHAGADPRVELRGRAKLSTQELDEVARRLERLDRASRHGPWTSTVLALIDARPEVRAAELAEGLGRETQPFKRDVRAS